MTDTPPDWVLIEAAKRSNWIYEDTIHVLRQKYHHIVQGPFRALCDMIQKYEQPPVDRKLLCAREAWREWNVNDDVSEHDLDWIGIRAIELWEEGFGRD
jgi:hypothetical protein